MFDSQGRFATLPFDVYNSSHLGQALLLDQLQSGVTASRSLALGQDALNPLPLYSGYGVVLYDRQAFLADAKIVGYTEGDYIYGDQSTANSLHLPLPPFGPQPAAEANLDLSNFANSLEAKKQQWLDANGTLLTTTRFTGGMTKAE
jgi:hypothetical protein